MGPRTEAAASGDDSVAESSRPGSWAFTGSDFVKVYRDLGLSEA